MYALNPIVALAPPSDPAYIQLSGRASGREGTTLFVGLQAVVDSIGWEAAKQYPNVRKYLQRQGTEAVRDIVAPDAWVMALQRELDRSRHERVIITDVRFPNEAAAITQWGGTLVRVVRLNEDNTAYVKAGLDLSHPSEVFVSQLDVDIEFACKSLHALQAAARSYFSLRVANPGLGVAAQ